MFDNLENHMVSGAGFSYERDPILSFDEQMAQENVETAIMSLTEALNDLNDAYSVYSEIFGENPSMAIAHAIEKIDDAIFDMRRELRI